MVWRERLASCSIVHYSSYIKNSLVKWTWTVWKAGLFQVSSRSTLRGLALLVQGSIYFKGGPNISVIFGPGDPNIEGVQISRDRSGVRVLVSSSI